MRRADRYDDHAFRARMTSAPWACQLEGLVGAALSEPAVPPVGFLADQLFYLSEQLSACIERHQDIDIESVPLVLDTVWLAVMEHERRAA